MTPDRVEAHLQDIEVLEREAPEILRHFIGGIKAAANKLRDVRKVTGPALRRAIDNPPHSVYLPDQQ